MTGLPGWLTAYGLNDDALAVLANRGLVRRGSKETGRLQLLSASNAQVDLTYTGTPPVAVTLLPGGPRKARCGCPVAGVCVHIVAACVWARTAVEPSPPTERVEITGSRHARPAEGAARPAEAPDVLAELLALDPAKVNRAAGVAAVRRVAAGIEPTPTSIVPGQGSVRITWPGAAEVIAVSGGGFAGMLVGGHPGDVEHRAACLEAVVRVFAAHDRAWSWPDQLTSPDVVQPGQLEALDVARQATEASIVTGLSRIGADGVARLRAAAQRARLEALPLLGILLTAAAGRAAAVAARDDDTTERDLLDSIARAWALAEALRSAGAPLPTELVGGRSGPGEAADTGVLVPLAARWWNAPSGARGLTLTMWDGTHHAVETVTTGRAAGQDPGFQRAWVAPLLWGASAQIFCDGVFTLIGAERREDGALSSTTRTRLLPGPRFAQTGIDLDRLAADLGRATRGAAAVGFTPAAANVRLVLPRTLFGVGRPELDEVNQQLIWPLVDRAGARHEARMDATGPEQDLIGALLQQGRPIAGVLLDDRDRPLTVFTLVDGRTQLLSTTLTPPERNVPRRWWERRNAAQQPRAFAGTTPVQPPLVNLCEAVLDVCEALGSTGRPALSVRESDTLRQRARESSDLGLNSLAAAVQVLLAVPVTPAAVLRATVVAGRAGTFAATASE